MTKSSIANTLRAEGYRRIAEAEQDMPVLVGIGKKFAKQKPLKGITVAACLHVTKETAVLMLALKAGGARVALAGSNPLSTQDDIVAALTKRGIQVHAKRGQSNRSYQECLAKVIATKPQLVLDDGADLIAALHTTHKVHLPQVIGAQEETTTGVQRLKAMASHGTLQFPVVTVNDTPTKHLFDNVYGTGQSTLTAIISATNMLLAGKTVVVAGYGHCGRGVAHRARGLGAKVIVTEIDPVPALQATMDGFMVMPMATAAPQGDVFVTVTGNRDVIRASHVRRMKNGAVLANAGHFDVEIAVKEIYKAAKQRKTLRPQVEQLLISANKKVLLLAAGRLVNLAVGEGHPSVVMDLSFANQALVAEWLIKRKQPLSPGVHDVPIAIDQRVAKEKLRSFGVGIDALTPAQKQYLAGWEEGT